MWGSIISGAGSLLGGLMGSDAAGDAAAAQEAATAKAIEEQRRQFDLNRQDMAPWMNTGRLANAKLAQLLGLGGTPGGKSMLTRDQVRAELLPKYTTQTAGSVTGGIPPEDMWMYQGRGEGDPWNTAYPGDGTRTTQNTIDEAGLQAAIDARMAESGGVDSTAGDYGSLLKRFSMADLNADPVYQSGLQFGLNEGEKAINQRAIAGGGYDSGATLKALAKYANDYGSTKANESYNRYNADQNSVYNKLAGVSGAGQQQTNQIASMGTSLANNVANMTTDAGNARAAGIMGGANAWSGALSGVGNAAQNYSSGQWLKSLIGQKSYQNGGIGGYWPTDVGNSWSYDK